MLLSCCVLWWRNTQLRTNEIGGASSLGVVSVQCGFTAAVLHSVVRLSVSVGSQLILICTLVVSPLQINVEQNDCNVTPAVSHQCFLLHDNYI